VDVNRLAQVYCICFDGIFQIYFSQVLKNNQDVYIGGISVVKFYVVYAWIIYLNAWMPVPIH
jgi:hypothetical protein